MAKTNGQWPASADGSAPWWLDDAPEKDSREDEPKDDPRKHVGLATEMSARALMLDEPAETEAALKRISEEMPSRLSGLKGLMSSLGLKKLGETNGATAEVGFRAAPDGADAAKTHFEGADAGVESPAPVPAASKPAVRPAPAAERSSQSSIPKAAPEPVRPPVTAQPEYLPPKEFVPVKEMAQELSTENTDPDTDDDLRILPARRGQYHRRR